MFTSCKSQLIHLCTCVTVLTFTARSAALLLLVGLSTLSAVDIDLNLADGTKIYASSGTDSVTLSNSTGAPWSVDVDLGQTLSTVAAQRFQHWRMAHILFE